MLIAPSQMPSCSDFSNYVSWYLFVWFHFYPLPCFPKLKAIFHVEGKFELTILIEELRVSHVTKKCFVPCLGSDLVMCMFPNMLLMEHLEFPYIKFLSLKHTNCIRWSILASIGLLVRTSKNIPMIPSSQ
jgi:hypothetical protein